MRSGVYLGIMAMVLLSIYGPARGADSSSDTSCISAIIPCKKYLNTTGTPPFSCCYPLLNVYKTDKVCLCNLLNDTSLLQQFQINITQAEELAVSCGLNANACSNLGGNNTTPPPPPPGGVNSTTPPGSPPPPTRKSAASSSSFEILPLLALLLLGVIVQVYQ